MVDMFSRQWNHNISPSAAGVNVIWHIDLIVVAVEGTQSEETKISNCHTTRLLVLCAHVIYLAQQGDHLVGFRRKTDPEEWETRRTERWAIFAANAMSPLIWLAKLHGAPPWSDVRFGSGPSVCGLTGGWNLAA